jgi:hypothetical protein
MGHLKVLGDLLECFKRRTITVAQCRNGVFEAVVDMILNERPLGLANRFFNRMQLLRDVNALATLLDHRDDASQVTVGSFEALDDCLMTLVDGGMVVLVLAHDLSLRAS